MIGLRMDNADFGERRSQAATGIKQADGNLPYGSPGVESSRPNQGRTG